MKNKYIKEAVAFSLLDENVQKAAKANGIYTEGLRLDAFVAGLYAGVYMMARKLGIKETDLQAFITGSDTK